MEIIQHLIPQLQIVLLPKILEAIAIREFMDIMAVRKHRKQIYYVMWYPIFILWLFGISLVPIPEVFKLLINTFFTMATMFILYSDSLSRLLLISMLAIAGNGLYDLACERVFTILFSPAVLDIKPGMVEIFCAVMMAKLTEMLGIKIVRGIIGYRRLQSLRKEDYFLYFLMPIVSILVMDMLFVDCILRGEISELLVYAMLGIIVLDIAIFHMMHRMEAYYKSESDLLAMNSHMVAQMENIKAVEQTHRKIRQISHGITTQLSAIETLLRHQKYQEAEDYLKSITDTVEQDMLPIHTNNVVVDALLNQRYILAHSKGIKMQFDIQDLETMKIRSTDMVSILSNGLNNAIEACEAIQDGPKMIEVKIINEEAELLISIQNTVAKNISPKGRLIPTSKQDKFSHGLGLEGISAVTDWYHGKMFLECENKIFKLVVVL